MAHEPGTKMSLNNFIDISGRSSKVFCIYFDECRCRFSIEVDEVIVAQSLYENIKISSQLLRNLSSCEKKT